MIWGLKNAIFVHKEKVRKFFPVSNNIWHSSVNFASRKPFCILNRIASRKHRRWETPHRRNFHPHFPILFASHFHWFLVITKAQGFLSSLALVHVQPCTSHNTLGLSDAVSLELKQPEREADHSPPSSAEIKEFVELYLHSPIRLHGVVLS
jgi:hypothetical protein